MPEKTKDFRGSINCYHIVIVGKNRISREGLRCIVTDKLIQVSGEANSLAEAFSLLRHQEVPADLILWDLPECSSTNLSEVKQVIDVFPEIRTVILFGRGSRSDSTAALMSGVRGFLPNDVSPEALSLSLRIVLKEKDMFTGPAPRLTTQEAIIHTEIDGNFSFRLSEREISILDFLVQGASNRKMAQDLDMGEAAVKLLLKSVLRKIKVCNRTQAAVWALEHDRSRWGYSNGRDNG